MAHFLFTPVYGLNLFQLEIIGFHEHPESDSGRFCLVEGPSETKKLKFRGRMTQMANSVISPAVGPQKTII